MVLTTRLETKTQVVLRELEGLGELERQVTWDNMVA